MATRGRGGSRARVWVASLLAVFILLALAFAVISLAGWWPAPTYPGMNLP
jgi:hypothetical protein